jgi:serine/threonine-protein kinase
VTAEPAAAAAADRERVGPYRLVKAIGAGGSARVDLARIDRVYGFQRHVVIKRPLEHLREDPKAAASLRREARMGGRLRHPNLVTVLDAGEHEGYDYLVLEYVHGASLRTLMQTEAGGKVRDVPAAVALAITADVARALHHAHELTDEDGAPLGLVHRDVSPGNVLVALDGAVKLADFGIAKETRVATLSGSMHGTVTYMAPEQCRGHAFDRRADVFSLGVICYELVTGGRLFWADNDVASLHRVLSGNVPRPRKVRPSVPPALEEIVMTAVAHDAERRFPTALALAAAIEEYAAQAGEPLAARGTARWVEEVLGPRSVPWATAAEARAAVPVAASAPLPSMAAPSVPAAMMSAGELDAAATWPDDGPLVDLIAAMPDDAPPEATFGPSEEAAAGDAALAQRPAAAPASKPRRRWRFGPRAVIAASLAAGAVVIGVAAGRAGERARSAAEPMPTTPTTTEPAPATAPAATGPVTQPEPAPTPTTPPPPVEPAAPSPPPAEAREPAPRSPPRESRPRKTQPRVAAPAAPSPAPAAPAETTPPPTPPPVAADAGAGSGSGSQQPAAAKPRGAVKWNPSLLLPSDSGSGSGGGPKR